MKNILNLKIVKIKSYMFIRIVLVILIGMLSILPSVFYDLKYLNCSFKKIDLYQGLYTTFIFFGLSSLLLWTKSFLFILNTWLLYLILIFVIIQNNLFILRGQYIYIVLLVLTIILKVFLNIHRLWSSQKVKK